LHDDYYAVAWEGDIRTYEVEEEEDEGERERAGEGRIGTYRLWRRGSF
jgi:hypothetical protein